MTKAETLEPPGRQVRCAKCEHSWFQEPISEATEEPNLANEDDSTGDASPVESETSGDDMAIAGFGELAKESRDRAEELNNHPIRIAAPWAALIAYLVVLGLGGYSLRNSIVTLWPRTADFYSTFGLEVNLRGMTIGNVTIDRQSENGVPVLIIFGDIGNTLSESQHIPDVQVALYDKDHSELYAWSVTPENSELAANEITQFRTRLTRPPQDIKDFEIRFSDLEDHAD